MPLGAKTAAAKPGARLPRAAAPFPGHSPDWLRAFSRKGGFKEAKEEEGDKGRREAGARGGGAATMRGATPGAHARARSP